MSNFTLTNTVELVTVAIRVKNRDKMIAFYRDCLGFVLKREENALAIMGTADSSKEQLWLEESPRATDHFGQVKKLQSLTLHVATMAEFRAMYQRVQQEVAVEVFFAEDVLTFHFADPEENHWIIEVEQPVEKIATMATFLAEEADLTQPLLDEMYYKTIAVNSLDIAQQTAFLTDVLGLQATKQGHHFPQHNWSVTTALTDSSVAALDSDEVIGLEILQFAMSETDLKALAAHLQEMNQAFYMDKKGSILTVYDPAGIEWWFLRQ